MGSYYYRRFIFLESRIYSLIKAEVKTSKEAVGSSNNKNDYSTKLYINLSVFSDDNFITSFVT